MKLILASNSPRRKEILKKHGFDFEIKVSDYSEKDEKDPISTAENNAKGKAEKVFEALTDKTDVVVLGADTIVVFEGEIIGKPKDKDDAIATLHRLSGETHKVITGYTLITSDSEIIGYDETEVIFNDLSDKLIEEYVKTGLPLDKAGSYGYQDGFPIVKKCIGDIENVIGLPFYKIKNILLEMLK